MPIFVTLESVHKVLYDFTSLRRQKWGLTTLIQSRSWGKVARIWTHFFVVGCRICSAEPLTFSSEAKVDLKTLDFVVDR